MICASCGGQVLWMGSWANLTHTQCQECGKENNQIPENQDDEDEEDKL